MTTTDVSPGPARYLGRWTAGSAEWHTARENRVGGSDIAAIVGVSPWASAFSLWMERRGRIDHQPERPEMSWGTLIEPVIVQFFAREHPEFKVTYEPGAVYQHIDRDFMVASPDALCFDADGVLVAGFEAKCDRFGDGFGTPGTDEIPPAYFCQVQWALAVFGLDTWYVSALVAGTDYRRYVVHANPAMQEMLADSAAEFLASLQDDEPPDIDDSKHTYEAIRQLSPGIEDVAVTLEPEVAIGYVEALRMFKEAEAAKTHAASLVLDAMGTARRALWAGARVARRQPGRSGALASLVPERGLTDKF
jgi:putative phage-type endonuclease